MFHFLFAAQCADVVVPVATEQAMRYYQSGNILWILQQAFGLIVPILFLVTGVSGKLSHLSARVGKRWFWTIVCYLILFIAIYQVVEFPLDFYGGYVRPHEYGLSTQTFSRWFDHYGKGFLVSLLFSVAFIWIFYLLLKKSPRRWWIYSSLVASAIILFGTFIAPIWIDPLFNRFGPMQNKELEGQILHLASRAGIQNGRVFEVDKSQDTKMVNAYVTGFGGSKRIVLWDTTIEQLTPKEILFVMGHEMGHYVLHHVWWGFGYAVLSSFLIFYLTYRLSRFLLHRYHHRFGFNDLSNIASLPLLLLCVNLFVFLFLPLSNAISCKIEHDADCFGIEITQNNQAAGEAFVVMQRENLANPYPGMVYKIWRSDHPPLGERVAFLNSYCPWTTGEPLKYGKYFQQE